MVTWATQLEKYPVVRLILPLVAGILCGDACPEGLYVYSLAAIGLLAFVLCLMYRQKFWFGVVLFLLLFLLGNQLVFLKKLEGKVDWNEEKELYTGFLLDRPQEKAHSYLLPLNVRKRNVLLYVAKDSFPKTLERGSLVYFYARIAPPVRQPVPGQFDYARYLQRQGVTGTAYAGTGYWKLGRGKNEVLSLKQRALKMRDALLERYRILGFRGDELAVLSALTLGDKSELKEELKETYSVTGASHVLALSGLHLGILYGICAFLLSFLSIGKATLWVRMIGIIGILWTFSFLVGLSPSVVRSACMFSLLAIGQCLNRKSLSLNTLAFSALLMLLYQPFYLFDVGFQLSYAAVASIIVLHPFVSRWWNPSWKILRYFWGIVSISLVAQIGVAPLILYYFSRFSVYFLLTNLLVIPLTFCLVGGTLLMLIAGFYLPLQQGIALVLNALIKIMHEGLAWIEQMPSAAIDCLDVGLVEICSFYLFMAFLVGYGVYRHARCVIGALACLACLLGWNVRWLFLEQSPQLLFCHSPQGVSVQSIHAGKKPLAWHPAEAHAGLGRLHGKTLALIKDNRWRHCDAEVSCTVDYMLIQRGFTGRIADLQKLFEIRHVVLDRSLGASYQQRLQEECKALKLEVISLSERGYWLVKM